jgi:hypothetical protein
MTWEARRGGGGVNASSGWRREGERDPRPVGRLSKVAAQRVGPKATRPKGRIGRRGDWAETELKLFSK